MDDSDRSSRADDAPSAGEPTRRLPVPPQHPGDEAYGPGTGYPQAAYPPGGPYASGSGYGQGPGSGQGAPYPPGGPYPQEPGTYPTAPVQTTAFGSPAYVEPGFDEAASPRKHRRIGGAGAMVAVVCVLLISLGGGYLVSVALGSSDEDAVPSAGLAQEGPAAVSPGVPEPAAPQQQDGGRASGGQPSPPPMGSLGGGSAGLGGGLPGGDDDENTSAALGVVASIDGSTFLVRTLDGSENKVDTDDHTYFATVRGTGGISKLAVGDLVFVGGKGGDDGAIIADMVLGGAFPDLGAGTP